jgi:5-guanidino-2-oxopentanoate decarboxylase
LTGGQALVRLLANYGVDTVFGIPGVHTLELYRGLPGSGIRHVLTRHEQGAGFMADGYARVSGKPGVCFIITGPGVTNAATAIGQAYADSIPMLVISSVNHTASLGKGWGCLHECQDQRAMTAPITAFSAVALTAEDLPELIARAYAVFDSERPRPVHISVPLDVLSAPVARDWSNDVVRRPGRGRLRPPRWTGGRQAARRQTADDHRRRWRAACRRSCRTQHRLAAPLFTSVAGKGLLPPDAPLNAGSSLCVEPGWNLIAEADVVLAVGTEMADTDFWRERLPLNGELLRVDIDPRKFNDFYPCAVALHGDASKPWPPCSNACAGVRDAGAASRGGCVKPSGQPWPVAAIHQAILERIAAELPDNAFISTDMTQLAYTGNYVRQPGAAQLAAPDRLRHPRLRLAGRYRRQVRCTATSGPGAGGRRRFPLHRAGTGHGGRGAGQPAGGAAVEQRRPGADPRRHARPGHRAGRRAAAQPGFRRAGPRLRLHRDAAAEPGGTANRLAPRLQSQRRHPDRTQACLRSLMFNLYWRE